MLAQETNDVPATAHSLALKEELKNRGLLWERQQRQQRMKRSVLHGGNAGVATKQHTTHEFK